MPQEAHQIILFYKFIRVENPEELEESQRRLCRSLNLTGRIIIGHEGINGTLEGLAGNIEEYKKELVKDDKFSDIVFKTSAGMGSAFPKLKIKVRDEIVTLGAGRFDPPSQTADTITAQELENLYEKNEDFVVLDLRNDYEIRSGAFDKSVDPGLRNFRDLPEKLSELEDLKSKKVVTVCTGGIRCEKATCLMKREGFKNVYQLKDGIHTYIKEYPNRHFKGTLFVFDNRMTTDVVPTGSREIIGRCHYCGAKTEEYYSDDSVIPSLKILCCDNCHRAHAGELRNAVTSKVSG
jgi:UPF0176 protein